MSAVLRLANDADKVAIEAFLVPRAHTSMFLLTNLADHGFRRDHPNAMRVWLAETSGGIAGLVGLTEGGSLMPQFPAETAGHFVADEANGGWAGAAARAIAAEEISIVLGPADQVAALRRAAGIADAPVRMCEDEPQYLLDLSELCLPEGPGELIPLGDAPRQMMQDWRAGYEIEALGTAPDAAAEAAKNSVARWIERDSHRALVVDGTPVAMSGFNAMLPDIVQVGGVWTPPELRRRGFGARAVALHLDEARQGGVARATLFAASAQAARVYERLGFGQIGEYTLCILAEKARARG